MSCSIIINTQFGWLCDVLEYSSKILEKLMPFFEVVALFMLFYSIYLYATAKNDQNKLTLSKNIAITVLSVAILVFIVIFAIKFIGYR